MKLVKNISIIFGIILLSFIIGSIYMVLQNILIEWATLGAGTEMNIYIKEVIPAPIWIIISASFLLNGMYFYKDKLILTSKIIIILPIVMNNIAYAYSFFI